MKFIAHRGVWNKNVKPNSYEAISNGLNSDKYIGIETDIRVTKDGVFILYHDALYNGSLVKNVLYKEIKDDTCKLEDILKIKSDKIFLLEIKDFQMNVKRFLKLLNKYKRNIMLMSFDNKIIERIRKETSNYKVGVLNYILNSDSDYYFDFICLLDAFSSNLIIESFKKRNIEVLIYGTIKPNQNLTYIIDDYKIVWFVVKHDDVIINDNLQLKSLCSDNCKKCRKILYYEHYYKNHVRVNLVFADARFKVILEKRDKYILLITRYYIKSDYMLNKEINRAKLFEKQKTPLD